MYQGVADIKKKSARTKKDPKKTENTKLNRNEPSKMSCSISQFLYSQSNCRYENHEMDSKNPEKD